MSLLDFCAELSRRLGIPWRIGRIDLSAPGGVRINVTGLSRKRERAIREACRESLPCWFAFEAIRVIA